MTNTDNILDKIETKQKEKIEKLTQISRANLDKLQDERLRSLIETIGEDRTKNIVGILRTIQEITTNNPTVTEMSLEKIIEETPPEIIDAFIEKWNDARYQYLDAKSDDIETVTKSESFSQGKKWLQIKQDENRAKRKDK